MMSIQRFTLAGLATLCVLVAALVLGSAAALATLPPSVEAESATVFAPPGVALEAQINPEFANTTYYFQYVDDAHYNAAAPNPYGAGATAPGPPGTIPSGGYEHVGVNVTGLAGGTTYHYRVTAVNAAGTTYGADQTFTTPPPPPVVSTGAASAVTQSGANVDGTVNPETLETSYYYEYGPTTEYGQSAPALPGIGVGSGSSAAPAPAALFPLTPGTTYHYRLVAINADGTGYGQDQTFTTVADQPPVVSTGSASSVSVNVATISGTIDPRGIQSGYRFEYGTDTGYGTQTFGTASPDRGVQTVTLDLRGIEAGTTYHYRLVASNLGGTTVGEDETFTTPGVSSPIIPPLVTPLIAVPAIKFPTGAATPKALTKAQKLAASLNACKRKPKKQRAACQKQVRKKYAPRRKKM
jgi:hypothetical protein